MSDTPEVDPTVGVLDPTTPGVSLPASERRPELPKGRVLGERYEIIKLLGRGGMGAVYAAHDHKLDRQVALKLLHSTRSDAPERLVSEAKALARLSDSHVVAIYDAGDLDGQVFIAMQLVDGEDLASALARRRPTVAQIISWFADAGRGLAAAHAAHLVHRDFKPSNVLIDRNGNVAVTDFGLARTTSGTATGLTGMGVMLGTPAYMSPEQHTMQPAGEASDQFSFCVALWESLFQQHPYIQGDRGSMSPYEIGYQIFDGALVPPPPTTRVSRRVIEALTRGLQRDPAKRWPSMTALVAELQPDPRKRTVWPIVMSAGLAAAALGGAAVWILTHASDSQSCDAEASSRVRAAWSPDAWTTVREHFSKAGRTYGDAAARQVSSALDAYAAHWVRL
ncbi:MAG: protein kinase, partial [Myxococcales bacterium]|nr:protein kinase [Myxococcales bacterium]